VRQQWNKDSVSAVKFNETLRG